MATAFLVTRGDYSDYHIYAVFTTKEKAQDYIDSHSPYIKELDFNDIEEYDLDPEIILKNPKDYKAWEVVINKEFKVLYVGDSWSYIDDAYLKFTRYRNWDTNNKDGLSVFCFAPDKEHAIKIAADKLREVIATVGWGNLIK